MERPAELRPQGRAALLHCWRALAGEVDEASAAWLQRGLAGFMANRLPLHRCLGLPNATRLKTALRDLWISRAAAALGGSVAQLHQAAVQFERVVWPVWRDLAAPPSSATAVEGALFYARRTAPFPTSRRAFTSIVAPAGKRKPRNASQKIALLAGRPQDCVTSLKRKRA